MILLPRLLLCGVASLALLSAGCGGGPKPVPVRGVVLYKNKPLCPANIYFQSTTAEGKQAFSKLQMDGSFTMTTQGTGEGVVPGLYKVTLSGLGNAPDLADYGEKEKTPLEIEVPEGGLDNLTIEVPLKKGKR